MKQNKSYKWWHWKNDKWSIDIDLERWVIGVAFFWNNFACGISFGPLEIEKKYNLSKGKTCQN